MTNDSPSVPIMTSQLSPSREDKDLYAGDLASGSDGRSSPRLPTTYTPSSTQSGSRRQRRRLGRFIHSIPLLPRLIRYSRVVLGPSTPTPDNQLPIPQASLSLSLTLSAFSRSTPIDPKIRKWSQRWRLHYGLYPFLALWAMAFVLLIREQYYRPSPDIIACNASVWSDWPPDSCGLNGTDCVDALVSGQYRCMGRCLDVTLGNPRWVGGEEVNDVPLVIGGSQDHTYRADSWVCPSAIHAGLISASLGGCVDLRALDYPAGVSGLIGSSSNGVQSLSFAPQFYGAFALSSLSSSGCMDLHPIITSVNAICLFITTVLLSPRPGVLFTILLLLGYVQILLVSNSPSQPPNWDTVLGRLPPTLAAGYWMWRVSFKRTLEAFTHLPLETALWQGAGFWIGVESSTIFASLPIDRLGYGQLSASGVVALVVIIVVVLLLVLVQAWQARKFGMLQYYLVRYIWLAPILLVLAFIPDYTLRLHHYLYALAAIPVLSLPNRVSLFGQAFALGLFLDGTGRWGWDSILEYTASLLGDAFSGTGTPLFLKDNSTASIISWFPLAGFDLDSGYQGVAMVVDDVLRVANATNSSYPISTLGLDPSIDHFFRLAFSVNGSTQDYTDPIVLYANGTWDER